MRFSYEYLYNVNRHVKRVGLGTHGFEVTLWGQKLGYLVNLDTDLRLNKPQLDIAIDRDRAAQLGVSVTDIGGALETFLGGKAISEFKRGTKQYDVIAQLKPTDRSTPDAIPEIYLRGNGGLVQLANVVKVQETVAPKELNHYNRQRSATITANLVPGVSLGKALNDLDLITSTKLPVAVKRELAGQSKEFRESSGSLYFLFLLAVVFIYLVLAAQFESFIHPLTILLSVPLAVVGAIISLFVFGQSMNIFSQIGLIMLIGLVTKNSILIVEYANQLRARGLETVEAVSQAAKIRRRLAGAYVEVGDREAGMRELRKAHDVFARIGATVELDGTREDRQRPLTLPRKDTPRGMCEPSQGRAVLGR